MPVALLVQPCVRAWSPRLKPPSYGFPGHVIQLSSCVPTISLDFCTFFLFYIFFFLFSKLSKEDPPAQNTCQAQKCTRAKKPPKGGPSSPDGLVEGVVKLDIQRRRQPCTPTLPNVWPATTKYPLQRSATTCSMGNDATNHVATHHLHCKHPCNPNSKRHPPCTPAFSTPMLRRLAPFSN